ncbi:MAG: aminotransferase class V-fold PLP-dependent enzyme [Clostridia bacterium]|nr:aminotransferase class V-fold PLP-dependent enzyme [Clostridia bacterium]
MIYLDNAATSFPKPKSVIRETLTCIKKYCANSGRSSHKLAIKTNEEIYKTREAISNFLSLDAPENVCFTTNATYALNIAIKTLITTSCHVIISDIEHNSVLRPIHKLKETINIEYSYFSTDGDIEKNIKEQIKENTKAIICNLMSNVTGEEIPLEMLSEIAKKYGLILIVDASQIIGHKHIDLADNPCDALCAPGHKGLFGIQGCGFVVFNNEISKETLIEGGSGNESLRISMPPLPPEHFEAGTLPTPSIVALRAGIDFINSYGIKNAETEINRLTDIFFERVSALKNIECYGAKSGIISFRFKNRSSSYISGRLNDFNIYTRSGLHCSPLAHKKLGTVDTGLVRISLSLLTKESYADNLYVALQAIGRSIY